MHQLQGNKVSIRMKKVHSGAQPVTSAYDSAAGLDISAIRVHKEYDDVVLLGTGWALEIPETHYVEIHERSSTHKEGFTLANNVGIVDSDYRGEIFLAMRKTKDTQLPPLPWRCAQLIVKRKDVCEWVEVDELSNTKRGEGGFGSSDTIPAREDLPRDMQELLDAVL